MTDPTIPAKAANNKTLAIQTFAAKSPLPAESHAKEFFKAVRNVFLGIGLVVLGMYASHHQTPWLVWVSMCVAGFFVIAPRTIKGAFQFIIGAVRDVLAAKKGDAAP